jgi:DNA-binding GntR family transcriptional regulator
MPYEYTPPKYAQVIAELQRRMESGEYPPGSLLPSEHQLSGEFAIARPTVVRALRVLRQEGWIETQQGKGSFVRGRPALARVGAERRGQAELDRDESREPGELISVDTVSAPARISGLLGVEAGTAVLSRRRLVRQENGEPSEITTLWVERTVAERAGLDTSEPVRGGVRALLDRVAGLRIDHVVEQVTARLAEPHETRMLGLKRSSPILALYVSARDASGHPVLALDVAMPGDLHELEDAYSVS